MTSAGSAAVCFGAGLQPHSPYLKIVHLVERGTKDCCSVMILALYTFISWAWECQVVLKRMVAPKKTKDKYTRYGGLAGLTFNPRRAAEIGEAL